VKFYLGTHKVAQHWWEHRIPLFVSRRTLMDRKTLPQARSHWALDSGGFTELSLYGDWRTTAAEYASDVLRFRDEMGHLEWAAPQDWMCEPFMLEKTGLTIEEHQRRTVMNFFRLRSVLGELVVPVLQGWALDDYLECWEMYERFGVQLELEPLVGLGSVCRRQNTSEAGLIVRELARQGLHLHYFGAKVTGLDRFHDVLASADSLAWSYQARRERPMAGCHHKACSNCSRYALRWRARLLQRLNQLQLEVAV
jgi:hypothetical protein